MASRPELISREDLDAYREDGAVVVRDVVPGGWIERMRVAIDDVLARPGPASVEYTPADKKGRYLGDFFVWQRHPEFEAFMRSEALTRLAHEVLGSEQIRFFYDQLLVKEPLTEEETPWHQDLPYWPLRGNDILSIWVPFDPATRESGVVTYLKGSHRWGKMFAPNAFSEDSGFGDIYEKAGLEPLPPIAELLDGEELLIWELEPGDVLLHHPQTLHFAAGNQDPTGRRRGLALRYVGEDCVWDARPGTFMENPQLRSSLPEIDLEDGERLDHPLFPVVWPA